MDSIAPSSFIVMRLSSQISASARSVFGSVMDVCGRRSCGSFSTRSLPSLKHLHHSNTCIHERHSSPYCCWSLWWISMDGTFFPRNLITMRCSTLRGTFCLLITLAPPRQDWTGSNPRRRNGGGCAFTLSWLHSCCTVWLVYTQISPSHIWTTLYYQWPYSVTLQISICTVTSTVNKTNF